MFSSACTKAICLNYDFRFIWVFTMIMSTEKRWGTLNIKHVSGKSKQKMAYHNLSPSCDLPNHRVNPAQLLPLSFSLWTINHYFNY